MRRAITGFHQDDLGDWVAELDCGHNQHVRHRPPFQEREWVTSAAGRGGKLGQPLECPLCDRAELPPGLISVRTTPLWDESSMPAGLRRAHRIAAGTWGLIRLQEGRLRFSMSSNPALEVDLDAGSEQAIPPGVEHQVQPLGPIRMAIEFLRVERQQSDDRWTADEGQAGVPWPGFGPSPCA